MAYNIDEIKFMRKAFLPVLPLVYDDALSYIEFLGKVCDKCNEIIEAMSNLQLDVLQQANAYTDAKVDGVYNEFTSFTQNIEEQLSDIREDNEEFKLSVTNTVNQLIETVNNFNEVIRATTNAINERTDLVIEENNQRLLNEMQRYLSSILVVNYITGNEMSIQDMFNYLCLFHLTDPITYTELASKECTYTTLASYDMTYTDLVTRGGAIIQ